MEKSAVERIRNTIPFLTKRQKRLYLANEVKAIGWGGISQVSEVSGVSRVTITEGLKEINSKEYEAKVEGRSRKKGGGRNMVEERNPEIIEMLEEFLEPHTKGDPMNPLRWTSKSMRKL